MANAEMCEECAQGGMVLPSIESFNERWALPKVHFTFYDYFFKAVIGEGTWKRRLKENKRLGTIVAEAYTHAVLTNNYFAWLYQYKAKNTTSPLTTEYDYVNQNSNEENEETDDEDGNPQLLLFCADLDFVEVSCHSTSNTDAGGRRNFELVLNHDDAEEKYKEAKEDAEATSNVVKRSILEADGGHNDNGSLATYRKMKASLLAEAASENAAATTPREREDQRKRKRKSLKDLKEPERFEEVHEKRQEEQTKERQDQGMVGGGQGVCVEDGIGHNARGKEWYSQELGDDLQGTM